MSAGLEVLDTFGLSREDWKLCEVCEEWTFWEVCLMPEVHGVL